MTNVKDCANRAAARPEVAAQVLPPLQSPRLLDQVRERIRHLHDSIRTEQAYVHWVLAFVRLHRLSLHRRSSAVPSWCASARARRIAVCVARFASAGLA